MLTKIIAGARMAPVSARVAADAHPLPDMGTGKPAGASGTTDRGTVGTDAPVASPWLRFVFWFSLAVAGFAFGWTVGGHVDLVTAVGAVGAVAAGRLHRHAGIAS